MESNVVHAEMGWLVFRRDTSLYAQRFDEDALKFTGDPLRLADSIPVASGVGSRAPYSMAKDGTLVYYRNTLDPTASSTGVSDDRAYQIVWVNREGRQLQAVGTPAVYRGFEVSPVDARVAVHRHETKGGDVLVLEPAGTETRITDNASQENVHPVWSPDGKRIAYASLRNGQWGLYQSASDGTGQEVPLHESPVLKVPMSWSPDGGRLVFWVSDPKKLGDLWVLTFADKKAEELIATEANEQFGQISPDGKWIAYSSTRTGRREVWVQPFPSGSGRWQISPNSGIGASWPRWTPKTNELWYRSLGVLPDSTTPAPAGEFVGPLFSVRWKAAGAAFTHDAPTPVVRVIAIRFAHTGGEYHTYAVSPDGQRLLMYQRVQQDSQTSELTGPDPFAGLSMLKHWMPRAK
jgi:dipeptidyl aminopeptidase/acylaminoacyl peptidase